MSQQKTAIMLLRAGLAITFAYAGFSALVEPQAWIGFMPSFIGRVVSPSIALEFFSILEILLAIWLIVGIWTRFAALAVAFLTVGIMLTNLGAFVVTFRDVAILFAALALAVLA